MIDVTIDQSTHRWTFLVENLPVGGKPQTRTNLPLPEEPITLLHEWRSRSIPAPDDWAFASPYAKG